LVSAGICRKNGVEPGPARLTWLTSFDGKVHGVGYVAAWEVQSKLASIALVSLVAFASIGAALVAMLIWSLAATRAYYRARELGLPDLFEKSECGSEPGRVPIWRWFGGALLFGFKAGIAGFQAFAYSRTFCQILLKPAKCWPTRLARTAVLGAGLTFFGVATSHHMLRKAGYSADEAFRLSCVGSFLNVPYRILLSATVVSTFPGFFSIPLV